MKSLDEIKAKRDEPSQRLALLKCERPLTLESVKVHIRKSDELQKEWDALLLDLCDYMEEQTRNGGEKWRRNREAITEALSGIRANC